MVSANSPRYNITWFVNGVRTSSALNLTAEQVYDAAIPGEALLPIEGSRWHVMMRQPALQKMESLQVNNSFNICYQSPPPINGHDTEVITVTRVSSHNIL